jgi:acyl-CoA synthetase (AMP-forming)/AMP-acid ligase II
VENALYADPRVMEAAVVGVPDKRLGELVAAVIFAKPAFRNHLVEESLIALARERLVLPISRLFSTQHLMGNQPT